MLKDVAGLCSVSEERFLSVRSMNRGGFKRRPWRPSHMAQASPVVTDPPEPPVRPRVLLAACNRWGTEVAGAQPAMFLSP